ncbi:HPF/RaiA family ribosome-associated protein [Candidatus Babeliales bacterium]|nr:HPF/RaiA family ribosome-associated protein [Candidatus Babeliales bacterium]
MNRKISFHNMDHSEPLEEHVNRRLDKVEEYLKNEELPQHIEVRLTGGHVHAHNKVEIHLKTKNFNLDASRASETGKMYEVVDDAVDRIVALYKKEKQRLVDRHKKHVNEKVDFKTKKPWEN